MDQKDSPRTPPQHRQQQPRQGPSQQPQGRPSGTGGFGQQQGGGGFGQQSPPGQQQGSPPTQGHQQPQGHQPPQGQGQGAPPTGRRAPPTSQQGFGGGTQQQPPHGTGQQSGMSTQQGGRPGPAQGMSAMGPPAGGAASAAVQPSIARGQPRLGGMDAENVAQEEVYTVEPDTSVSEIVEEMDELNVGTAVVVEDDKPVDVITDRSIAMALSDDPNVAEKQADDLVDEELVTVPTGTDVFEVIDRMGEAGIRRILIVDDQGELEGIISLDDLLLLLEDKFDSVAETIEQQMPEL